jgi:hypothetical protein
VTDTKNADELFGRAATAGRLAAQLRAAMPNPKDDARALIEKHRAAMFLAAQQGRSNFAIRVDTLRVAEALKTVAADEYDLKCSTIEEKFIDPETGQPSDRSSPLALQASSKCWVVTVYW